MIANKHYFKCVIIIKKKKTTFILIQMSSNRMPSKVGIIIRRKNVWEKMQKCLEVNFFKYGSCLAKKNRKGKYQLIPICFYDIRKDNEGVPPQISSNMRKYIQYSALLITTSSLILKKKIICKSPQKMQLYSIIILSKVLTLQILIFHYMLFKLYF